MEADDLRRGRDVPQPVGPFAHVEACTNANSHLLRIRRSDAKHHAVVGKDAGIRCARNIERVGFAVGRRLFRGTGTTNPQACAGDDRRNRRLLHRVSSVRDLTFRPWTLTPEPVPCNSNINGAIRFPGWRGIVMVLSSNRLVDDGCFQDEVPDRGRGSAPARCADDGARWPARHARSLDRCRGRWQVLRLRNRRWSSNRHLR